MKTERQKKLSPWAHVRELHDELKDASERATAVVVAAYLDVMLGAILRGAMVRGQDSVVGGLFEHRGPLSSFSSKIDVAFALGLIARGERDLLHQIRDIRNKFAHHLSGVSFSEQSIRDKTKNLRIDAEHAVSQSFADSNGITVSVEPLKLADDGDYRGQFVEAGLYLIHALSTRSVSADVAVPVVPADYSSASNALEHAVRVFERQAKELEEVANSRFHSEQDRATAERFIRENARVLVDLRQTIQLMNESVKNWHDAHKS